MLSSRSEGGANAISEALACGVPVVCSRIPGSLGLLGSDYPATFPVGDTRALTRLLIQIESEKKFYDELVRWSRRLRPMVSPARERAAWRTLLDELA